MTTYYKPNSAYATTTQNDLYLNLLNIRPVPAEADDFLYALENQYRHRPDLLAYDLYGDAALWWVFVQRNMSVIRDPIYDFEPGVQIYIPKKSNLQKYLGI
jgi:Base plate wedge protein 53